MREETKLSECKSAFCYHQVCLTVRSVQFSSVQSLSHVWLFATAWTAARQASLSITSSRSSLRLMSIKSVMPSSHLILCRPLLLLPPIPPSIRGFSNKSALRIRWAKYWSFGFNISPSNEHPGLSSLRMIKETCKFAHDHQTRANVSGHHLESWSAPFRFWKNSGDTFYLFRSHWFIHSFIMQLYLSFFLN